MIEKLDIPKQEYDYAGLGAKDILDNRLKLNELIDVVNKLKALNNMKDKAELMKEKIKLATNH